MSEMVLGTYSIARVMLADGTKAWEVVDPNPNRETMQVTNETKLYLRTTYLFNAEELGDPIVGTVGKRLTKESNPERPQASP